MNKKGQTESYSFFIGIILTVLILAILLFVGVKLFVVPSGTERCFNRLVNVSTILQPGGEGSVLCDLDPEYVILGFDVGETVLGNKDLKGEETSGLQSTNYKRPFACSGDKPCLCLCKQTPGSGSLTLTPIDIECVNAKCKTFDGFLSFMGINSEKEFINIESNAWSNEVYATSGHLPTQVFDLRVERSQLSVGICKPENKPCIRGNLEDAYSTFQNFAQSLEKCNSYSKDKCSCDIFDLTNLGDERFIRLMDTQAGLEISLYQKDNKDSQHLLASKSMGDASFCFYKRKGDNSYERSDALLQIDLAINPFSQTEDYVHENKVQLYKYSSNQICFAQKAEREGFAAMGRRETSCEAKKEGATTNITEMMGLLDIGDPGRELPVGQGINIGNFDGELEAERVLTSLDGKLRSLGKVSRMYKSALEVTTRPKFRANWLTSIYNEIGGEEKSIAGKAYLISFIGLYKQADQKSSVVTDKQDNFLIYYLASSQESKRMAELVAARLNEIEGKIYKDSAQQLQLKDASARYTVNAKTQAISGLGKNTPIFFDYTEGEYDNSKAPWKWLLREKNDVPAIFIEGWEVQGDEYFMFGEGAHAEIFGQKIYEGVKDYLDGKVASKPPVEETKQLTLIDVSDGALIGEFDGKAVATTLAKQLETRFASTSKVRNIVNEVNMETFISKRRLQWLTKIYNEEAPQTSAIAKRAKLVSLEANYKEKTDTNEKDRIILHYLSDSKSSKEFAEKVKQELEKISGKYYKDGNEYQKGQVDEKYKLEFGVELKPQTLEDPGQVFTAYTKGDYDIYTEPWRSLYAESKALPSIFFEGVEVYEDGHYLFTGHQEMIADAIYQGWRVYSPTNTTISNGTQITF
ncbi:hypothetical protein HY643_02840 [Candidatus Woesearchaeota archaeon]|nr:hypothetical protein [Candidatus Woesearchaeota archaeon]